jgi:hypothetical protein
MLSHETPEALPDGERRVREEERRHTPRHPDSDRRHKPPRHPESDRSHAPLRPESDLPHTFGRVTLEEILARNPKADRRRAQRSPRAHLFVTVSHWSMTLLLALNLIRSSPPAVGGK